MAAGLRGVVFDAYGTLFDVYSIGRLAERYFAGQGAALAALWRDKQIEFTRLVSLSDPAPGGSRHYRPFRELTEAALRHALARLGLHAQAGQEAALMAQYDRLDAFADSRPVLEAIKARGLPTAILSNGNPAMLAGAVAGAGLGPLLDHVLSVEPVRHFKTHPACYQLGPDTFGVTAAELLFVSSNAWDALGATWFGYTTFWVNRLGLPFDELGPPPHHTGAGLHDLLALLD